MTATICQGREQSQVLETTSILSAMEYMTLCESLETNKISEGVRGNIIYKIQYAIKENSKGLLNMEEMKLIINSLLDYTNTELAINVFHKIKTLNS